jgi:MFS transporter, DHA2 family, glioxin efflux transporter
MSIFILSVGSFFVGLDQHMIFTITPKITDKFHSLAGMGWYGSAYFVSLAVGHLCWRKLYFLLPGRFPLFPASLVFAVGGVFCGPIATSTLFAWGRAFMGFGAAGILGGIPVVATSTFPKRVHHLTLCIANAAFRVGFVGSLVGGLYADRFSWKVCFYMVRGSRRHCHFAFPHSFGDLLTGSFRTSVSASGCLLSAFLFSVTPARND